MEELSEHESFMALLVGNRKIKLPVALNPLTKNDVLDILSQDTDEAVRVAVAVESSHVSRNAGKACGRSRSTRRRMRRNERVRGRWAY